MRSSLTTSPPDSVWSLWWVDVLGNSVRSLGEGGFPSGLLWVSGSLTTIHDIVLYTAADLIQSHVNLSLNTEGK